MRVVECNKAFQSSGMVLLACHPSVAPYSPGYQEQMRTYETDGAVIGVAVCNHLPAGTVDALMAYLLRRYAKNLAESLQEPLLRAADIISPPKGEKGAAGEADGS